MSDNPFDDEPELPDYEELARQRDELGIEGSDSGELDEDD